MKPSHSVLLLALMLASVFPAQASAQPSPTCPGPITLPDWPDGAAAVTDKGLSLGAPARIVLERRADGSFAGQAALEIERAGHYEISLGGPAWVDVSKDGVTLASQSHRHGPACSGIRKIVTFSLQPGMYEVRLSRSSAPAVQAMVTPVP
ncbi:hypothetical protein [Novosphingobium sp. B1]|uniref:hypothetical protein n=1 Tax=Novosphingobium sp. B1 TaxID=1938756 RepID=UPI0009FFA9AD|nr:hypothetical protein [Novosphingobium sp. B1]